MLYCYMNVIHSYENRKTSNMTFPLMSLVSTSLEGPQGPEPHLSHPQDLSKVKNIGSFFSKFRGEKQE